ncbi:hypothetical protein [Thalassomonas actiniarum]|uniref:Uncharacterized protein n=1 Tax=Thalassomonas actiniarum TaxID=485447 RepID=A0AAE9YQL5_9GAMM|nr:hypothetical protein [Thalassomonas actiniarum]WDD98489.1 hypothetical protein SG35_025085 [Thalassomonas actiniarum]
MRYVDKSKFAQCKTKTWDKNAEKWAEQVKAADDPIAEIKKIGNKWSSLKRSFVKEFGLKCWYTEVPQYGTDFDVDHFAPKGRVKNDAGQIVMQGDCQHPGYWWKAFDIENYRYSCIYANRSRDDGGKVDYFPIVDESKRAWSEASDCDYDYRQILDPCSLDDVKLLTFETDSGLVTSSVSELDDEAGFKKVKISRTRLNLDNDTIVKGRLKAIKTVTSHINLLKLVSRVSEEDLDQEDINGIANAKSELINACSRKSEFSAAVIQYVLPYKSSGYLADVVHELDLEP